MNKKVCFVGHRKIYDYVIRDRLKKAIREQIEQGVEFFTMGTCGEFDAMSLSVCRELKKQYPNIQIQVVITSFCKLKKQVVFDDEWGKTYEIPYSDVQTIMYDIEEVHFKRKITESNKKMIDGCDVLICYVNENRNYGGAKIAFDYAKKVGLQIINLLN